MQDKNIYIFFYFRTEFEKEEMSAKNYIYIPYNICKRRRVQNKLYIYFFQNLKGMRSAK